MLNFVGGVAFVLMFLLFGYFEEVKSRSLIKDWAQEHELKIISIDRRSAFKRRHQEDPFRLNFRSPIFYVSIEDNGVIKNVYIKIGNDWIGILGS